MRFFRSTWLQRILIFLFLALLNTTGFGFVAKQGELKNETVIHVIYDTPCLVKVNSPPEKLETRYVFYIIDSLVEANFKTTFSLNYILETATNAVSFDLLTCLKRGPPRSMTLL